MLQAWQIGLGRSKPHEKRWIFKQKYLTFEFNVLENKINRKPKVHCRCSSAYHLIQAIDVVLLIKVPYYATRNTPRALETAHALITCHGITHVALYRWSTWISNWREKDKWIINRLSNTNFIINSCNTHFSSGEIKKIVVRLTSTLPLPNFTKQ